jgi:membrane protein DedA with SNARE-associated domain
MATTAARPRKSGKRKPRASSSSAPRRWRTPLTVLLGLRAVLGLVAIPLAPVLYEDHFVVLVLIRPTKEVLLAGGFLVRQGDVNVLSLLVATIPMLFVGVWLFFALGRGYRKEIAAGDVPGLGGRVLPMKRVGAIRKVLDKKGVKLVVLGRLAAAPSTLFAATAGASRMSGRRFLVADGTGAVLRITVAGVAVLLGLLWTFGRYLRRE